MSKSRKLSNFIINPKFQYKMSSYFLVGSLAMFGGLLLIIYIKLKDILIKLSLASNMNYSLQVEIIDATNSIISTSALFFVLFCLFAFAFSIVISHRIAGPIIAIRAYIAELKKGNFEPDRNLRPYDDLHSIMDDLKDLAETLAKKGTG